MADLLDKAIGELSPSTSMFKVLTYLSFRGARQPSHIAEGTEIPPGTVRPALRTLLDMGYVVQDEDGAYRSKIPFTDIISALYTRTGNKG